MEDLPVAGDGLGRALSVGMFGVKHSLNQIGSLSCLVAATCSFVWAFTGDASREIADSRVAKISAAEAKASLDSSSTLVLLCEAQRLAREMATEQPLSPVTLLQYAAVRKLLGSMRCPDEKKDEKKGEEKNIPNPIAIDSVDLDSMDRDSINFDNMNFDNIVDNGVDNIIDFALARSPFNKGSLLAAAMIENLGESSNSQRDLESTDLNKRSTKRRVDFLRRALLTPEDFVPEQISALRQQLDSGKIIEAAVPVDFRSVLLVAQLKRRSGVALIEQFQDPEIRAAVARLQERLLNNATPGLDRQELARLAQFAASPEILARIDAKRAALAKDDPNKSNAEFFSARATVRLTPTINGVLYNDLNPELGVISRWRAAEPIIFDDVGVSLVAAVPDGASIRAIQLSSSEPNAVLKPDEVQFWVSDDDFSWSKIEVKRTIDVVDSGVTSLLFSLSPPMTTKFVKVRFAVAVHRKRFKDSLDRMLQVFSDA